MSPAPSASTDSFPTQARYDSEDDELIFTVDAFPADIDDVAVAVGSRRLRIRIGPGSETGGVRYERIVTSPPRRTFTDEREAVYNNGVLTVTVGAAGGRDR
ncbi:hypothetical protein EA462_01505 [Natrarchaeobius halalkaliphilus]|uniref:Hsp20/alpha crystallin family protein n=1 Tax=Natrarchaeobius halalkaliphilus TaxID=1679091 RepID=A0A3N6P9K3_9EURY|nr:Hsp20/alpha crystallin family protein [Natrarchaeobius halalkaliphilus]RQG92925.1 hypothetical protein EA462_01505 [Natrarchaeobius halalkaliphilus]